jgi:uncharacterized protein (UPF0335 family)
LERAYRVECKFLYREIKDIPQEAKAMGIITDKIIGTNIEIKK